MGINIISESLYILLHVWQIHDVFTEDVIFGDQETGAVDARRKQKCITFIRRGRKIVIIVFYNTLWCHAVIYTIPVLSVFAI